MFSTCGHAVPEEDVFTVWPLVLILYASFFSFDALQGRDFSLYSSGYVLHGQVYMMLSERLAAMF